MACGRVGIQTHICDHLGATRAPGRGNAPCGEHHRESLPSKGGVP
jgi:hypothetical protein